MNIFIGFKEDILQHTEHILRANKRVLKSISGPKPRHRPSGKARKFTLKSQSPCFAKQPTTARWRMLQRSSKKRN
jgi:hypothetical protein